MMLTGDDLTIKVLGRRHATSGIRIEQDNTIILINREAIPASEQPEVQHLRGVNGKLPGEHDGLVINLDAVEWLNRIASRNLQLRRRWRLCRPLHRVGIARWRWDNINPLATVINGAVFVIPVDGWYEDTGRRGSHGLSRADKVEVKSTMTHRMECHLGDLTARAIGCTGRHYLDAISLLSQSFPRDLRPALSIKNVGWIVVILIVQGIRPAPHAYAVKVCSPAHVQEQEVSAIILAALLTPSLLS